MTPLHQHILRKDFPLLYDEHFCFETGDGWFGLIYELSSDLNKLVKQEKKQTYYRVVQVKSKFAELRYYMDCTTTEMDALVNRAESLSRKTCEYCGEPGTRDMQNYWLHVRCENCVALDKK